MFLKRECKTVGIVKNIDNVFEKNNEGGLFPLSKIPILNSMGSRT